MEKGHESGRHYRPWPLKSCMDAMEYTYGRERVTDKEENRPGNNQ